MYESLFDYRPDEGPPSFQRPTYARRLGSALVDGLMFVGLVAVIWVLAIPAVIALALGLKGRTPGKQAFGLYVLEWPSGAPARMRRIFVREVLGKVLLPLIPSVAFFLYLSSLDLSGEYDPLFAVILWIYLTMFSLLLYYLAGLLVIFFNPGRRAFWDYLAGTCVRYQPKTSESNPENPALHRLNSELRALPGQGKGSYL